MSFEDFDARSGAAASGMSSYQAVPGGRTYADDLSRLEAQVVANTRQLAASVRQLSSFIDTLGSGRDSQQLRDRIAALVDSTRDVAKATAADLKELSTRAVRGAADLRARIPKHGQGLQTLLTQFQELSRVYQKKITSTPVPPQPQQPASTPTGASSRLLGSGNSPFASSQVTAEDAAREEQQALLAARQSAFMHVENERTFNDSLIREREEGIHEIEQSITEVNQIFRDLATITVQQSALVDDIESNIENTAHNAAKGVSELQKASNIQRSNRSKICCIALTIAIICAVSIVLVFLGVYLFK